MYLHTYLKPRNAYEIYAWDISPKLKKIDLCLKTSCGGISVDDAAELLEVSGEEVARIMREEGVAKLNRNNFFGVMLKGSSEICRYVRREVECGSPIIYTKEEIAYIYDLNSEDVSRACDITGIKEATAFTLPELLIHIPVA